MVATGICTAVIFRARVAVIAVNGGKDTVTRGRVAAIGGAETIIIANQIGADVNAAISRAALGGFRGAADAIAAALGACTVLY
jgi:hypothetical protein